MSPWSSGGSASLINKKSKLERAMPPRSQGLCDLPAGAFCPGLLLFSCCAWLCHQGRPVPGKGTCNLIAALPIGWGLGICVLTSVPSDSDEWLTLNSLLILWKTHWFIRSKYSIITKELLYYTHLLYSIYFVLGTIVRELKIIAHLIHITALWDEEYCHPSFYKSGNWGTEMLSNVLHHP